MDIYKDDAARNIHLKRYFTEAGKKALEARLDDLIKLYIGNQKYPFKILCYGFPVLKIHSKIHHEGMIDELSQILVKEKVEVRIENGT